MRARMSLELSSPTAIPISIRIAEFKEDPQKMDELTSQIDDILKVAQQEANKRMDTKKRYHRKNIPEQLAKLRKGDFSDDDKDVKCYTLCIAQITGLMVKKIEISYQKMLNQINIMLPDELKKAARETLEHCKDVQNNYKDPCDRVFYSSKCGAEYNPKFTFP